VKIKGMSSGKPSVQSGSVRPESETSHAHLPNFSFLLVNTSDDVRPTRIYSDARLTTTHPTTDTLPP
jgi:hypothetical protein